MDLVKQLLNKNIILKIFKRFQLITFKTISENLKLKDKVPEIPFPGQIIIGQTLIQNYKLY